MKLQFKKVLNEADISRGNFLNQVKAINSDMENSLSTNASYSFISKPEGFFIKNKDNIISTITVKYDVDKATGNLSNFRMKATKIDNYSVFEGEAKSDWLPFERTQLNKAVQFYIDKIKSQFEFTNTTESLDEFYDPKTAIKNLFKGIKNGIQQSASNKEAGATGLNIGKKIKNGIEQFASNIQDKIDLKALMKKLADDIMSILNATEGFKNCTLTPKTNFSEGDNSLEIRIGYNYLYGIGFGNDGSNIKSLVVEKLFTFLNPKGEIINKPWDEFKPLLEKKLGIIVPETDDPNKADGDAEKTDDKKETETTPKTEEPKDGKTEQTPDSDQQGVEVAPSNATPEVSKETVAKAKQDKLIDEITPKGTPVGNELQGVKNFKAGDIVQGVDGKFMRISKHFKLENPVITLLNPSKIYRPTNNLIKALDSLGLKIMVKDGIADESLQEYLEPDNEFETEEKAE